MPKKKRARSFDMSAESDNHIMQIASRKAKKHPRYDYVFQSNTVAALRGDDWCKDHKGWYTMKKPRLVSVFIVSLASSTISRFFKMVVRKRIGKIIRNSIKSDDIDPISHARIIEIDDPCVHDGIVFSKTELTSYFMTSYNFVNPITRRSFNKWDISKFDDDILMNTFDDRSYLRRQAVYEISHFSFLETEFETLVYNIVGMYDMRFLPEYMEMCHTLDNTWKEMVDIDRPRTRCTIRSMEVLLEDLGGRKKKWAHALLKSYTDKSY